jgi:hypothetical protein
VPGEGRLGDRNGGGGGEWSGAGEAQLKGVAVGRMYIKVRVDWLGGNGGVCVQ